MRGHAKNSTNLPEPTGPTDERFVYHLTPEGRQVLADHEKATGEQLHLPAARSAEVAEAVEREQRRRQHEARREAAKRNGHRFGTITYRWRGEKQVPELRVSGLWLEDAGFGLGQEFEVSVCKGRLLIVAV